MNTSSNVHKYFSLVANNYTASSGKGLWQFIRRKEARAVLGLLASSYENVLELGSGSGFYSNSLRKIARARVTCVDFSQEMLDCLSVEGCDKVKANIETYIHNESCDLIFCAGVLEFVNAERVFSNFYRMGHPKIEIVLLFPVYSITGVLYWIFHKMHNISIHLFSKQEIEKLSLDHGFVVDAWERASLLTACCRLKVDYPA